MPKKHPKFDNEVLTWYYPASTHYGFGCGVCCDWCNKTITHAACVGYETLKRSRDMCLPCLQRLELPFRFKQKHRVPVILQNIPTHLHIINYGNLCLKDDNASCHRCKRDTTRGMESERGFYCLKCVHRLTMMMRPLDRMFVRTISHDVRS